MDSTAYVTDYKYRENYCHFIAFMSPSPREYSRLKLNTFANSLLFHSDVNDVKILGKIKLQLSDKRERERERDKMNRVSKYFSDNPFLAFSAVK